MSIKVEEVSGFLGLEIHDPYGRIFGTLVTFYSNVHGEVEGFEVKVADDKIVYIEPEKIRVDEGKLVVFPEWKFRAITVIEALDRALKRKKAIEKTLSQSDLPGSVIETYLKKLNDDIKKLKNEAVKAKTEIKVRINRIEDEVLHVDKALVNLQITYLSGEISDTAYRKSSEQLKRIKGWLLEEMGDARSTIEKIEKLESSPVLLADTSKQESKEGAEMTAAPNTPAEDVVVMLSGE
ncbi:MAG: CdvA-like protein [Desulfurococcales archaeon]|nr:CdvA-like protein [Desulfurococcales archaeon]